MEAGTDPGQLEPLEEDREQSQNLKLLVEDTIEEHPTRTHIYVD